MRAKSLVLLMLALGCGVVASVGIHQVISNRGEAGVEPETSTVFIAVKDIMVGEPIAAHMVKSEEWPKGRVPMGAISKLEDLENRRPKGRIYANSPILDSLLLTKGASDQGAADGIPKGYRLVSVKVDDVSGNASLIRPGDRVDVIVFLDHAANGGSAQPITRTILQDVKVYAVGQLWDASSASGEKSISAKTVSLLVTPSQVEVVTQGSEMGRIRLASRSPDDKELTKVKGASAQDVLGGETIASDQPNLSTSIESKSAPVKPSPLTGLLGMLNARTAKTSERAAAAAAEPAEVKPPDTFVVRVISGSQVSDTVLESKGDPAASAPSDTNFLHWKINSSAQPPQTSNKSPKTDAKPSDESASGDSAEEDGKDTNGNDK